MGSAGQPEQAQRRRLAERQDPVNAGQLVERTEPQPGIDQPRRRHGRKADPGQVGVAAGHRRQLPAEPAGDQHQAARPPTQTDTATRWRAKLSVAVTWCRAPAACPPNATGSRATIASTAAPATAVTRIATTATAATRMIRKRL